LAGYLSQDEVDALLKGISGKVGQDKGNDFGQSPENHQNDGFSADQAVKKSPLVERVEFAPFKMGRPATDIHKPGLNFFKNITLELSGELGATEITVRDFLRLTVGSVIKLDKMAGESAAILLNGQYLGLAEVVVINDRFGLRVTAIGAKESEAEKVPREEKSPPDSDSSASHPEDETGHGG
jgi:flagellar motor switch protein FliN/FliY